MGHRPHSFDSGARYLLVAAVVVLGGSPVRAQAVTEFPVPTASAALAAIAAGPDGALWFTETTGNKIGRISTSGAITEFTLPTAKSNPGAITAGPDGAVWFAEDGCTCVPPTVPPKIGRIAPDGSIVEYPLTVEGPMFGATLPGIVTGPDGTLWFTENDGVAGNNDPFVSRITAAGAITKFQLGFGGGPSDRLLGITSGSDGALWVTTEVGEIGRVTTSGISSSFSSGQSQEFFKAGIASGSDGALWYPALATQGMGRITTAGTATLFPYPASAGNGIPGSITNGPDGALWFAGTGNNQVGRVTTAGVITEFTLPTGSSQVNVNGIATGSDGALWFIDTGTNAIWQLVPAPSPSPLLAAVLPLSRSVQVGVPATVFATIVSTSGNALANCFPSLPVTAPPGLTLDYRPTDPTTNMVTGSLDQSVTIGGNGSQSFVLGFTTTAPTTTLNQLLTFGCGGVTPVSPIAGVNTVNLLFSPTPVPDVIALAATDDPGYVDIPSATGTGEFAVATINLGIDATITVAANKGAANLPVALTICQTNPSSGLCVGPPTATVITDIQPNATPTFGVFVIGSAAVADMPGTNRVFVTFTDAGGTLRGETSVAVRTQ
jgi:streptogramin lyase